MIRRLAHDETGVTVVEFAIVAPVLLMLLMVLLEIGYYAYADVVLRGAVAQAARNSTVANAQGNTTAIDDQVTQTFHGLNAQAVMNFSRTAYDNYDSVGKPEEFIDANGNGQYDEGECFVDVNGNGKWDADQGQAGQGSAVQIVVYTATATYPSWFPVTKLFGGSGTTTVSATTQLMNQPFGPAPVRVLCS